MTKHSVVLIPGDGIGVETSAAMQRVVAASGADIDWAVAQAGAGCIEEFGTPLPDETVQAIREHKTAIKGPVTTPVGTGFRSVNVALRKTLSLYVNLRPVMSIPGAGGRYDDVNLVIVRENTEDLYAGIEFEVGAPDAKELIAFVNDHEKGSISEDSGISIKPISVHATRDIVDYAFDYAERNGRRRVTAVHKANIMKHSDGLFLRVVPQPVRRHRQRPGSRPRRRPGTCAGRQHWQGVRCVRSRAWVGARHRREEPGESDRADPVCSNDARPPGRARGGGAHPRRHPRRICEG